MCFFAGCAFLSFVSKKPIHQILNMKNLFSFIFTNLITGEVRQVMLKLNRNLDGYFQASTEDGKTWADDAETPNEAIENGAWIDLPKQWGWKDVKRTLPARA